MFGISFDNKLIFSQELKGTMNFHDERLRMSFTLTIRTNFTDVDLKEEGGCRDIFSFRLTTLGRGDAESALQMIDDACNRLLPDKECCLHRIRGYRGAKVMVENGTARIYVRLVEDGAFLKKNIPTDLYIGMLNNVKLAF